MTELMKIAATIGRHLWEIYGHFVIGAITLFVSWIDMILTTEISDAVSLLVKVVNLVLMVFLIRWYHHKTQKIKKD